MRRPATLSEISAPLPPARCVDRPEEAKFPPEPSAGPDHYVWIADDVIEASRARQAAMEAFVARALPILDRAALCIAVFGVLVIAQQCLGALS